MGTQPDTLDATASLRAPARTVDSSHERAIEVEALLQAVTALWRNGVLTEAEYHAKRRRLTAHR